MTGAGQRAEAGPDRAGSREVQGPRSLRRLYRILWAVIGVLILLLLLRLWVITPYGIPTDSMAPTLRGDDPERGVTGDTVLVNKLAYLFSPPRRWDIVAFSSPVEGEEGVDLVKRVVGLPGERVRIENERVVIDGRALDPPPGLEDLGYLRRGEHGRVDYLLGAGEYFLLGDNSPYSQDSRHWGGLPRERIFGRVIAIIRPGERMRWIDSPGATVDPEEHPDG